MILYMTREVEKNKIGGFKKKTTKHKNKTRKCTQIQIYQNTQNLKKNKRSLRHIIQQISPIIKQCLSIHQVESISNVFVFFNPFWVVCVFLPRMYAFFFAINK
jgi:hypothetical protein